jgi:putative lipoic acid-binding regulatory protein
MEDRRRAAIELLESQHEFPGPFEFRVIIRSESITAVVTALAAIVGNNESKVDERRSSGGRWTSVRYAARVESAEKVLEVYELLRGMEEVVLAM